MASPADDTRFLAPVGPVLSVVIPVRNRPEAVCLAANSVLAHAGSNIEVVVVDDGSTDDTLAAVERIKDSRLRAVSIPASGVSVARNEGVAAARAAFIAFLDSDDYVLPGWVDAMVGAAQSRLDLFSCASIERHDKLGDSALAPSPLGAAFGGLIGRFQSGAFGVSRRAFEAAGGFVAGLRHGENTVLGMALGRLQIEEPLAVGSVQSALVVLHRRDRPYDADLYYESAVTALAEVGDMLGRDRSVLASHLGIAGVAAGRSGLRREALRLLGRSIAARPSAPIGYARWCRALVGRR
ncbi:MAG: glycosyltransferase family A protein [Ilumatobacteraceae bacterium]